MRATRSRTSVVKVANACDGTCPAPKQTRRALCATPLDQIFRRIKRLTAVIWGDIEQAFSINKRQLGHIEQNYCRLKRKLRCSIPQSLATTRSRLRSEPARTSQKPSHEPRKRAVSSFCSTWKTMRRLLPS